MGVVVWEPSSRIGGDGRLAKGEIVDANRVLSVWEERWVAMRRKQESMGDDEVLARTWTAMGCRRDVPVYSGLGAGRLVQRLTTGTTRSWSGNKGRWQ